MLSSSQSPGPIRKWGYGVDVKPLVPGEWAEVVLRDYARTTNRLLAGRLFGVAGDGPPAQSLAAALREIGATVRHVSAGESASGADETFANHLRTPTGEAPHRATRSTAAARIDWAASHMPVVAAGARGLAELGQLSDRRIGICLVLEPKTAVLALALAGLGAQVSVYGHPEETDPEIAAELRRRGVPVFADPDPSRADELADQFLAQRLNLLIDDGSRLIRRLLAHPEWAAELIGAAEETTSGLTPLRALPQLPFPVVAVNDAGSKRYFDNAHGTGQSCLFTCLDLLAPGEAWPIAGRTVVVAGFGPVGEGFARHAAALGAQVLVADPDPIAELRARFAGYRTGALLELVGAADLVVSASGHPHTITPAVLAASAHGAAIAVAGGVEQEVDWELVVDAGATLHPVRDHVEELRLPEGKALLLLDRGGCINCTAGEGNPIEIMDLSFGVQLAALEWLTSLTLPPGVQPLPIELDRQVSALALQHWGSQL